MSELANCPFCGSDETFTKPWSDGNGGDWWLARCSKCGSQTTWHCQDESHAIAAWNRRAPAEPSAGWRGIESAPKDGTPIDIWVPGRGRLADRFWSAPGTITRGGWAHREIRHRRWVSMVEHETRPTYWRPVPSYPSEALADPLTPFAKAAGQ